MEKIIFISGWGTDELIWGNIADNFSDICEMEIIPWWETMRSEKAILKKITDNNISAIAGWSLGGLASLKFAIDHKELVKKLILISSTSCMISKPGYDSTPEKNFRNIQQGMINEPEKTAMLFARMTMLPQSNKQLIQKFKKSINELDWQILSSGLFYLEETDIRTEIKTLDIPALIIHGENDAIIPISSSVFLKKEIKNSKKLFLSNEGHGLILTNPSAIKPAIKEFICG